VTPPERPTAPKPGQQPLLSASAFNLPPDAVLGVPGSSRQPSVMGIPQLPSSETPKLKDFLPFMKPGSFGPKAQVGGHESAVKNDCAPGSAGSLPASVSASPVHLPQAPVSFPPSPQRQLPVSLSTSNGYGEVARATGIGFVHADAGYPVAEALLSPTAPPGAPRSASPAHQQPIAVAAHPGGPAENQQQTRPIDMPYNIPQNYNQQVIQSPMSVQGGMLPVSGNSDGAVASYAGVNGHSLGLQGGTVAYSGHNFNQPGMPVQSGVHTHALPANTSSFLSQVPGQPVVLPSSLAPPANVPPHPSISSHPHDSGLLYSSLVPSTNLNQSYPGGSVATSNIQQPNIATAAPGVPVHQITPIPAHQVNSFDDVLGQFPPANASQPPSNVEGSQPHYYSTPVSIPPTCTAQQLAHQSVQPRPPSYEAVTQHYPPPAQPMNVVYPPLTQPQFTGQPPGVQIQPGLPSAQPQTSYYGSNTVHFDASYGGMQSGHLPAGSQQPTASIHPQQHNIASQPQQLPLTHQTVPSNQRPLATPPQHPAMPASAAYLEQQPPHMSQKQPRYPVPSQTVPGVPAPAQHLSGLNSAPGQSLQYATSVQIAATQPQPRYASVPTTLYLYPSGGPQSQPAYQNTNQQPVASQIHPMHTAVSHIQPSMTTQLQPYQQYPVQPSRPEVGHTLVYPPGSQPQPRYPTANQAYQNLTSSYHMPPSANSQQLHNQSAIPQQQPAYHPGSSQPHVVGQSTTVTLQTAYTNQQQPPHTAEANGHDMSTAPGEMQAFADIPICLPSPLQPSRVTTAEVSKNIDSLRDLDLSSSASSAQSNEKDAVEKPSKVHTVERKDLGTESSSENVEAQLEKSEEETHHSFRRQSRSSRDVYTDAESMSRFVAEVEKFQKHVDSLVKPTLGGYFPLDKEWKVRFWMCVLVTLAIYLIIFVLLILYLLAVSVAWWYDRWACD